MQRRKGIRRKTLTEAATHPDGSPLREPKKSSNTRLAWHALLHPNSQPRREMERSREPATQAAAKLVFQEPHPSPTHPKCAAVRPSLAAAAAAAAAAEASCTLSFHVGSTGARVRYRLPPALLLKGLRRLARMSSPPPRYLRARQYRAPSRIAPWLDLRVPLFSLRCPFFWTFFCLFQTGVRCVRWARGKEEEEKMIDSCVMISNPHLLTSALKDFEL